MGRHSFPGSDEDDDGFASGESSYPDDADYSDPLGSFGFGDAEDDEYVDDYYDYSDDDYGTGTSTGYADADPAQYMRQGGHDEESRYQTGPFGAVARSAAARMRNRTNRPAVTAIWTAGAGIATIRAPGASVSV